MESDVLPRTIKENIEDGTTEVVGSDDIRSEDEVILMVLIYYHRRRGERGT